MSPQAQGHLAMLVFSAMVAGSFALGALAANDMAPSVLNTIRFVLAAVIVLAVALATTGVPKGSFRAPWRYLVLGALYAVYFVLMFEGLKTAAPVSASAVFTLVPIMSAGFALPLLGQILTGRIALALGIGGLGALWVIFRGDPEALARFDIGRGEVIYFIGCIAHAAYTPMVRKLNRGEGPLVFAFGTITCGAVLMGLWGWRDFIATDWANVPNVVWITILYTAVFATALTIVLIQFATLRLPSAKVMAYTYLVPSWVIVWQFALHGEVPAPIVLVGVAATVAALLMLLRDDA